MDMSVCGYVHTSAVPAMARALDHQDLESKTVVSLLISVLGTQLLTAEPSIQPPNLKKVNTD